VINGARLAGALQIIAIDVQDSKLATAERFGATHTVNASEGDPVAAVRELTGRGAHHVFEVVGLPRTQQQAPEMARPGGGVWFVGLGEPGATLTLPSSLSMLRAHTTITGVHMGSTNLKRDIPMYVELYLQGRLNLDDLVTQEIGLGDIDRAYEQLKRGEVVRSVITSF
jgi:S-(hydroxymethyl)glutathione dehydrogenase/alcohol dehydrogenase